MTKKKVGRPQTYTPEQIEEIRLDFEAYIHERDDPTIVGFTANYEKYSINKDYMSDHTEFSELRKRAIEKQEDYLLKNATINKANPTIAIFRLKQPQHGYRDRTETDLRVKELPTPILGGLSVHSDDSDKKAA